MKILFFVDLFQDVDLLLPFIEEASKKHEVAIALSSRLKNKYPQISKRFSTPVKVLSSLGIELGFVPLLKICDAVFVGAESNARPHRLAHRLVKHAKRLKKKTYTVQHGLENIGLTYFDRTYPSKRVKFASDKIFIWGPVERLHKDVPAETRNKCIPIGFPRKVTHGASVGFKKDYKIVVSVFENLHWSRFDAKFIDSFLTGLTEAVQSFPHILFIIKTHPDGKWFLSREDYSISKKENVIIVDPEEKGWEALNVISYIKLSDAVISTPSTTVADSAAQACPVAVVASDLQLPLYEPLTLLRKSYDWHEFLKRVEDHTFRQAEMMKAQSFIKRISVSPDPVSNALGVITGKGPSLV